MMVDGLMHVGFPALNNVVSCVLTCAGSGDPQREDLGRGERTVGL